MGNLVDNVRERLAPKGPVDDPLVSGQCAFRAQSLEVTSQISPGTIALLKYGEAV